MNAPVTKLISSQEATILSYLQENVANDVTSMEVTEISSSTGICDNDEVLRALYTLEGKSLVSPEPVGDFTSSRWQITNAGVIAVQMMAA